MTHPEFEAGVHWLADYRAQVAAAKSRKDILLAELYDSASWQDAQKDFEIATELAAQQTDALRDMAIVNYEEEQDKHPHEAVNIRLVTQLEYPEKEAIAYAREHLPQALSLNKREFEKVAKVVKLDFVRETQEPQATIAQDLSKWL